MRTVVVGAGPTGLFTAIALARRGREVSVIDRDPGPPQSGPPTVWQRKGVMQFHHAHTFRGQVVDALRTEMPDVLDDLITAGATIATTAENRPVALLCRRTTFERTLWNRTAAQQGITLVCGHVDRIEHHHGRTVGVRVDDRTLTAGLVIDASGRSSRFTDGIRPPAEGGDCGAVYVTRQYRLLDGADTGPMNSPIGLSLGLPGYWAIVFLHDNSAFSITFTHDGTDKRLRLRRRNEAFDDAVRAIPLLADWIDSSRAQPTSPALPGGRLHNTYRGQLDATGRPVLPGLIAIGDAVCTTTPLAGRGVALALMQARQLVRILDLHDRDITTATKQFDRWTLRYIRPWFDDHRHTDTDRMRRWCGGDIDVSHPLPSDVIVAAAEADPALKDLVGPYTFMDALPASLAPAQARAREIYAGGWRPQVPDGPTREQLSSVVSRTPAAA
jgi:2-polyprenyl-6-methoxyphenol hydroxylase-like FAD-dependent oxidoreductase